MSEVGVFCIRGEREEARSGEQMRSLHGHFIASTVAPKLLHYNPASLRRDVRFLSVTQRHMLTDQPTNRGG
ncbi:hypothetical protein INR49_026700 [Caranx melampygus]|nr:hypothetical protein INR49_026700 [Caranx melampygus]